MHRCVITVTLLNGTITLPEREFENEIQACAVIKALATEGVPMGLKFFPPQAIQLVEVRRVG